MENERKNDGEKVAALVRDAGGQVVGRTKLQKVAYLLEASGLGDGFRFDYHHYGPYSEELASAANMADALGLIKEKPRKAAWGGAYSIYTAEVESAATEVSPRGRLARVAAEANATVLELAATAAYLADKGEAEPWMETAARKPDKAADDRLEEAKRLYEELRSIAPALPVISK